MQRPYASNFQDPKVRNALGKLAELASAIQPIPTGCNEKLTAMQRQAQAMRALAEMASRGQPVATGGPGPKIEALAKMRELERGIAERASQSQGAPCAALIKQGLNGGELSPELGMRHDLPRYQMGCEVMLNMCPLTGGGMTKRPGFQFVSGTGGADAARLIPFVYSASISLMLMFLANSNRGQLYILDRDGKAEAVAACTFPYTASELGELSLCQCGKFLYAAHRNHPPAKFVYDGSTFTYEIINFKITTPTPSIAVRIRKIRSA
ncbi:MAG: hypothetical protein NC489_38210, partial [Ruminococcus flavefaciens]|nr:hypothetical protein [Ruminococcus flavefaciens]